MRYVPQPSLLVALAHKESPIASSQVAQAAVPHDRDGLLEIAQTPGRCLWDLPVFAGRGWPRPTCGGPRSCDGACARVALSGVQSWLGTLQGRPCVTGFGNQVSGPPIGYLGGGPVWHASIAWHASPTTGALTAMWREAEFALRGVGDAAL